MAKPTGPQPKYSTIPTRGVVLAIGDHRVVKEPLCLKYGLERLVGHRDGRDLWLSIQRETLRDDLIVHMLDEELLTEATLAELVVRMGPYVGAWR
ncbi:MAG: hypothetical protein AAF724_07085 [Pseudomonadota bacterium]